MGLHGFAPLPKRQHATGESQPICAVIAKFVSHLKAEQAEAEIESKMLSSNGGTSFLWTKPCIESYKSL